MSAVEAIRKNLHRLEEQERQIQILQVENLRLHATIQFLAHAVELLSTSCTDQESLIFVRDGLLLLQAEEGVRH